MGNAHREHAKEVMERLAHIVQEDKVSRMILAEDSVLIPLLVGESLPDENVKMLKESSHVRATGASLAAAFLTPF